MEACGREEKGAEYGGCLGLIALIPPAKAVSVGGVPVRGKGGILCQVGRGLLLEIPALFSKAKSQFCALAMVKRGATEGAYRIRSRQSLSRSRGKEEVKERGRRKFKQWLVEVAEVVGEMREKGGK